jgi:glutathionyl-hydroquinone reductase
MTTTSTNVADPVDFERYGRYAPPPEAFAEPGGATLLIYPIGDRLSDLPGAFPAEAGRYHLYVSLSCPWAQRPLIALNLRGLDEVVTWSAVDPVRDGRGWAFRVGPDHGPDPVNGFALLREAYLATDPTFAGHISVPALWDRTTTRLVSNHYPTLTVDLETQFSALAGPADLYPHDRRGEIDELNERTEKLFFRPAGAARLGSPQAAAPQRGDALRTGLEWLDERLEASPYLLGDRITDADILLFVALVRFDNLTAGLDSQTRPRLSEYPRLWAYARGLYQHDAFGSTTNFAHIHAGGADGPTDSQALAAEWGAPLDHHVPG